MKKIRVMVFPGAHNLPLYLMSEIEITYTKSRNEQISAIQQQQVDIIHTSPDNLSLDDAHGLIPFLAGSVGPLSLFRTKNEPFQVLGVDNVRSGFGRLAYVWLQKNRPDLSYKIIEIGGTLQRFEALKNGNATMAIMHPPFSQLCEFMNYEKLGRIDEGYSTLCGVYHGKFTDKAVVDQYKNDYREAIGILAGLHGHQIAAQLVEEYVKPPVGTIDSIVKEMIEEIVKAGVNVNVNENMKY